jgi:hypothetical protein
MKRLPKLDGMAHRIALGLLDSRLLAEAIELDRTPNWPSFPAT